MTAKRPRRGSLQFYPRKRAAKVLPSANWRPITSGSEGLLGFIAYKAGMASALIKNNTEQAITKGKQVILPVTILEVPSVKIYSVRFYKNSKVIKDIIVSNDRELKHILKVPKEPKKLENAPEGYDDVRVVIYSVPKQAEIKKTPDIVEVAISAKDKFAYVKNLIGKELSIKEFIRNDIKLIDAHALTKGKGLSGPVKRFGIAQRQHKSEKGVRNPGSIGPWHPAHTTFRAPLAGQLGMFTRVHYNIKILGSGSIKEKDLNPQKGFSNYGKIKTSYLILKGSIQGPAKRQVLLTPAQRPSKKQSKQNYELLEVLTK